MKKLMYLIVVIVVLGLIVVGCFSVVPPAEERNPNSGCATIQDGTILDTVGNVITFGYDEFGYNYQSHIFNGRYCDCDRVIGGPYCDVNLVMKWNDAWLSNKDCDGDGLLDRPDDNGGTYIGSGAWCTNHQSGEYEVDGKKCKWTYFVKIVAVPEGAYKDGSFWYTANDIQIGEVIWGAFAIVQQVENDACADLHGIKYLSPVGPGFGKF